MRITESQLRRIVRRMVNEQAMNPAMGAAASGVSSEDQERLEFMASDPKTNSDSRMKIMHDLYGPGTPSAKDPLKAIRRLLKNSGWGWGLRDIISIEEEYLDHYGEQDGILSKYY